MQVDRGDTVSTFTTTKPSSIHELPSYHSLQRIFLMISPILLPRLLTTVTNSTVTIEDLIEYSDDFNR
jgi:hypothetical protein